jgi:hypothetical protein
MDTSTLGGSAEPKQLHSFAAGASMLLLASSTS